MGHSILGNYERNEENPDIYQDTVRVGVENGLYNHAFLPTENDQGRIYCIWENKQGVGVETLQKHIDTLLCPKKQGWHNKCRQISLESAGKLPYPRYFY